MRSKPILLNLLVISFPLFFIWNCGPRKNDAIDTNTDSTVNHSSKVLAQVLTSPDTNERQIQSGQFTFTFEPSTKKNYNQYPTKSFHVVDSSGLRHEGLNWYAKDIDGNEKLVLSGNDNEDSDNFVIYEYVGSVKNLPYWVFKVNFYEGGMFTLVNKNTGEKVDLVSTPIISPDQKWLISVSSDLIAQYNYNGFMLFEIKDHKIIKHTEVALKTKGIEDAKWINNNTLMIKENYIQNDEEAIRYSILRIKNQ
ncbi:hypothetical protein QM480_15560 [Flectobacillus sp. DC10W]|uniref:Uncharacterized protein n=1 Tax=Flectobacillus longus TaxID=2984207 RepID=A0ABT6YQC1_9BACT|nr:hypothetical protein [Flectobacillus longus]MDI9865761.1 hypothetical protein [Flectobacillus longus]